MKKNICGIQQIGIGVPNVQNIWKWYREAFGIDIKIFEEAAEAPLMTDYTGNKVQSRTATLALSMEGGGGFEIWQYTSRDTLKANFEIQAGDYGLYATKIKSKDVIKTFDFFNEIGLKPLNKPRKSPNGSLSFFIKDPNENLFQIVESISYMDLGGNIFKIGVKEVDFSYRSCSLLKNNIALEATLLGQPDNIESIAERMASFSQKRWSKQPKARSAGCIFKNPECISAGQLIDELGFKGESEGGAMVSEEHGNFIVNKGGATAEDFLKLIERIRRRAHDERSVDLKTEVQIIGRREDRG